MRLKKYMLVLVTALLLIAPLKAGSVLLIIVSGEVISHEESESITIAIDKTSFVEVSLRNVRTVAILESKKVSDGVAEMAAVAASTGAGITILGSDSDQSNEKRAKNVGVVVILVAGVSAFLKAGHNWLTQKEPAVIFDSQNGLNDLALINNLPVGTNVRITLYMH